MHVGGHFSSKATSFKIIRNGCYWPSIFQDSYKFARSCDKCQKFIGKERISAMPLQHVLPDFPFSKWGLDFTSSSYYLQGNGQAESTNKNMVSIIKRLIEDNPHQCHTLLTYAL
jgi:hypothetical protein